MIRSNAKTWTCIRPPHRESQDRELEIILISSGRFLIISNCLPAFQGFYHWLFVLSFLITNPPFPILHSKHKPQLTRKGSCGRVNFHKTLQNINTSTVNPCELGIQPSWVLDLLCIFRFSPILLVMKWICKFPKYIHPPLSKDKESNCSMIPSCVAWRQT